MDMDMDVDADMDVVGRRGRLASARCGGWEASGGGFGRGGRGGWGRRLGRFRGEVGVR